MRQAEQRPGHDRHGFGAMPIPPDFQHLRNVADDTERIECSEREDRGLSDFCHRVAIMRFAFHHAGLVVEGLLAWRQDADIAAVCAGPEDVASGAAPGLPLQECPAAVLVHRLYRRPWARELS